MTLLDASGLYHWIRNRPLLISLFLIITYQTLEQTKKAFSMVDLHSGSLSVFLLYSCHVFKQIPQHGSWEDGRSWATPWCCLWRVPRITCHPGLRRSSEGNGRPTVRRRDHEATSLGDHYVGEGVWIYICIYMYV